MTQAIKKIMVVDDEPDVGETVKIILERDGYSVDFFMDPSIALNDFKPDFYDLAILDIKMPNINGFELYKQLKSKDPKIKTLFLSALTSLETYKNPKYRVYPKKGERQFLRKPVSNRLLLEGIHSMTN